MPSSILSARSWSTIPNHDDNDVVDIVLVFPARAVEKGSKSRRGPRTNPNLSSPFQHLSTAGLIHARENTSCVPRANTRREYARERGRSGRRKNKEVGGEKKSWRYLEAGEARSSETLKQTTSHTRSHTSSPAVFSGRLLPSPTRFPPPYVLVRALLRRRIHLFLKERYGRK